MPRVFIVEQPRQNIDVGTAEQFGEITYVFGPSDRRPSMFDSQAYIERVLERLVELKFDPESDFVLVAGAMNSVALLLASLVLFTDDCCTLLMFNSSRESYVTCPLSLGRAESLLDASRSA